MEFLKDRKGAERNTIIRKKHLTLFSPPNISREGNYNLNKLKAALKRKKLRTAGLGAGREGAFIYRGIKITVTVDLS